MLYLDENKVAGIGQTTADMGSADYELFTIDGSKVATGKLAADGHLSTLGLAKGVYVLKATKNGKTTTTKVSVNR